MTALTPEVEEAIAEIRQAYPGHRVEVAADGQGGAYVVVNDLEIGDQYAPSTSWVGFQVGFQYPQADVYPHFIVAGVRRLDSRALGDAFSGPTPWRNRSAIQVSRRSNRLNPATDSAALKLTKVLDWIRSR
jgi:hypothetical protein